MNQTQTMAANTADQIDQALMELDDFLFAWKTSSRVKKRLLAMSRKIAVLWEIHRAELRNDAEDVKRLRKLYASELGEGG